MEKYKKGQMFAGKKGASCIFTILLSKDTTYPNWYCLNIFLNRVELEERMEFYLEKYYEPL